MGFGTMRTSGRKTNGVEGRDARTVSFANLKLAKLLRKTIIVLDSTECDGCRGVTLFDDCTR